ncbi:hypothetical protein ACLB2K_035537 [Fragaria x ananassa]
MSSIDTVTKSFATSFTLVDGRKAPDLGKIGRGLQNFQIQERGDPFLVSFESMKDQAKVLKGGAWCFDYAPIFLEEYDGITPMADVPLRHVRICSVYNMITHAGEKCDGTQTVLGTSRGINFGVQPKPIFAFSAKLSTSLAINPAPVVSSSSAVKRKHVVVSELETSPIVLEVVAKKDVVLSTPSKKREHSGGCSPSLKKFKTIMGDKLLKLQVDSLGLVNTGGNDELLMNLKKKLGRPLGSRNRVYRSTKKTEVPLRISYPVAAKVGDKASPNAKGKGKT